LYWASYFSSANAKGFLGGYEKILAEFFLLKHETSSFLTKCEKYSRRSIHVHMYKITYFNYQFNTLSVLPVEVVIYRVLYVLDRI